MSNSIKAKDVTLSIGGSYYKGTGFMMAYDGSSSGTHEIGMRGGLNYFDGTISLLWVSSWYTTKTKSKQSRTIKVCRKFYLKGGT